MRGEVADRIAAGSRDGAPGSPVHDGPGGIGGTVTAVGTGREERNPRCAIQGARRGQRELLAAAPQPGRRVTQGHRGLPTPDAAAARRWLRDTRATTMLYQHRGYTRPGRRRLSG